MRISDWSSDVCSSDLPGDLLTETAYPDGFLLLWESYRPEHEKPIDRQTCHSLLPGKQLPVFQCRLPSHPILFPVREQYSDDREATRRGFQVEIGPSSGQHRSLVRSFNRLLFHW